jgi:phage terminase large subunit-like protein
VLVVSGSRDWVVPPGPEAIAPMARITRLGKAGHRLVLAGGFDHGGHPVLRQHAKVCAVESDAAGNIKPSKEGSSQRIDGVVAGVMALGIAVKDSGSKVSVYETRGVRRV